MRGATGAGGATLSYFRFSVFSFGGFGAMLGVVAVAGETEAFGAAFSRSCLFLPLSRAGAGDVTGGTDAEGDASGDVFSFRLFLFFSGVVAGLIAGLTEAEAFGAGELFSFRLFFSWTGEIDGLAAGALGLADAAGLVAVGGVTVAVAVAGVVEAPGLEAAFSEAWTVGGGTDFGSSFFILSFNSACALGSPTGSHPRSTGACASFSFTTLGAICLVGF